MAEGNYVIKSARLATMAPRSSDGYSLIENAALIVNGSKIAWIGLEIDLPSSYTSLDVIDCEGRLVTPAFIDCHTHIVAGGNRAREFEMRLNGATYEEIARAGGGIVSTVEATRRSSETQLLEDALSRVDALIAEGTSLIEVKSGYGLDIDTELKMLRVARRISAERPVRVTTSFLGAHAVPKEFEGRADQYIDAICIPCLVRAHDEGLVDCVDGFCEGIAFSPDQIERVFRKARERGLPVKLHAEQLSNLGGAKLAARYGALSADHIEYIDEDGVMAMSQSGSIAVLLPGAFYTLKETQMPPVQLLRRHAVPLAVATDCNPGSSPISSLLLSMNMACTLFGLTPQEALAGVTREAARALGYEDTGTLEIGKRADIAIWNVREPSELSYRIGFNPLRKRIFGGHVDGTPSDARSGVFEPA